MHRCSKLILPTLLGMSLFIAGCHSSPGSTTTTDAQGLPIADQAAIANRVDQMKLVAQGVNKELSYKAPDLGKIILYDQDSGLFVYEGLIVKGEVFVFEPASSRAQINKQTVDLDRLTNEHDEYRLYFVPQ